MSFEEDIHQVTGVCLKQEILPKNISICKIISNEKSNIIKTFIVTSTCISSSIYI